MRIGIGWVHTEVIMPTPLDIICMSSDPLTEMVQVTIITHVYIFVTYTLNKGFFECNYWPSETSLGVSSL